MSANTPPTADSQRATQHAESPQPHWPDWLAPQIRKDITRGDKLTAAIATLGWLCYVVLVALLVWVMATLIHNNSIEQQAAQQISAAGESWPPKRKSAELQKAYQYNDNLKKYFNGRILADTADENGDALERRDSEYQNTLNVDGKGGMARLLIPKISVDVPVSHTTQSSVLSSGAGHVYGTALPVGQNGTQSVIAAHSGGFQGLLFTRLGELKDGDTFIIDVAGERQAYRVFNTRTIDPNDMESALTQIRDAHGNGSAIVTLVTCTPVGVNTHRLLVSADRVPDAQAAFAYSQYDAKLHALWIALSAFALTLAVLFAALALWHKSRPLMRVKHRAP